MSNHDTSTEAIDLVDANAIDFNDEFADSLNGEWSSSRHLTVHAHNGIDRSVNVQFLSPSTLKDGSCYRLVEVSGHSQAEQPSGNERLTIEEDRKRRLKLIMDDPKAASRLERAIERRTQ